MSTQPIDPGTPDPTSALPAGEADATRYGATPAAPADPAATRYSDAPPQAPDPAATRYADTPADPHATAYTPTDAEGTRYPDAAAKPDNPDTQTLPPPEDPAATRYSDESTDPDATLLPSIPAATSAETAEGWVTRGYEILGELGRGGMGVVYKARQLKLNRLVALKMILSGAHAGGDDLARFRTEAEAVARLQHAHIVQVYEVGEHDGRPFFSLEFCPGGALDKKLNGTPLPPQEAARLVETLARAVQALHQQKVVHRDLKPSNVLLTADGQPKITDFGLAKKLDEVGQTQSGAVMGTPSYMAPEQAGGKSKEVGPAADVYALGAILYECLTGRPPFKAATSLDTLMQVVADEPVPPRQLQSKTPRDLETICLKCLAKESAQRYDSAEALAEDLERWLRDEPVLARPVGALERAAKWARRNPSLAMAYSLLWLAPFLLVIAFFAWRGFETAVVTLEDGLTNRSLLSDRFTAQFAAELVEGQMNRRWDILEKEAQKEELHRLIRQAAGKGPDEPERVRLQEWLDQRREQYLTITEAQSWVFADARGDMLAASPLVASRKALGKNYAWRSYFHGGDGDVPEAERANLKPTPTTHIVLSMVFESSAMGHPRTVVLSAPVIDATGATLGVLGMGVNPGTFHELDPATVGGERQLVLVETRKDWEGKTGLILQHPWLRQQAIAAGQWPKVRLPEDAAAKLGNLHEDDPEQAPDADLMPDYPDPVRAASKDYDGRWLAAAAPVIIDPRKDGDQPWYTGWVVVVEERSRDATADLKSRLLSQGLQTLAILLLLMAAPWGFVLVMRLRAFLRERAAASTNTGSGVSGPAP